MTNQIQYSLVLETPAPTSEYIHRHFINKLSVETDVSDVKHDMKQGLNDFVLIDVRSTIAYGECHIPGALSLPSNTISEATTASLSRDKLIVVYCWGPACNGASKGAAHLSRLGFQVKEMLGGIEYWRKEGNEVEGTLGHSACTIG